MQRIIQIHTLSDIDNYLKTQETEKCNISNYVWTEYGFLPILFNETFREFFINKGKHIGLCFPGHQILYKDKVHDLLVLNNFIDTQKAYKNNKETDLLIENFKKYSDRGIAFWYTIRNFDEDKYDNILKKYKFKNILLPVGRDICWSRNLFSSKYATGEKDYIPLFSTYWNIINSLGWSLKYWKEYNFISNNIITEFQKNNYYTLFFKNSWKSRNYRSSNITDFLVDAPPIDKNSETFSNIIEYFNNTGKNLVIINDLIPHEINESKNIKIVNMFGFFDIQKFCDIIHNSICFITTSHSSLDLACYYCDTNFLCINDYQNKIEWVDNITKINNKQCMSFNTQTDSFYKITSFFNDIDDNKVSIIYNGQARQDEFVNLVLKKRNGYFLEIGSNHPIEINNTYTLYKNLGWTGIMIEYDTKWLPMYKKYRPDNIHIFHDATTIDFLELLQINNSPEIIDYLQIDLEVNNRSTLTTLENLSKVFNKYKFRVVTFEHDIYSGDYFDTRKISREIFDKNGYLRVFSDVCNTGLPYEDWYIFPTLVDMEFINKIKTHESLEWSSIISKMYSEIQVKVSQ